MAVVAARVWLQVTGTPTGGRAGIAESRHHRRRYAFSVQTNMPRNFRTEGCLSYREVSARAETSSWPVSNRTYPSPRSRAASRVQRPAIIVQQFLSLGNICFAILVQGFVQVGIVCFDTLVQVGPPILCKGLHEEEAPGCLSKAE